MARRTRTRGPIRPLLLTLSLLAIFAANGAWSITPARADGDPASDVLATQQLFLPQDAAIPRAQQAQLNTLLQQAARSGYPIRLAIIASAGDLGSITQLWHQPQRYAEFLGVELSLMYHGPLLVLMPDGVGVYNVARSPLAKRVTASHNPPGQLGRAALAAVRSLAEAAGHPLHLPAAGATTRASGNRGGGNGGGGSTAWIIFLAGALMIAIAWAASLRARPPRLSRTPPPSA